MGCERWWWARCSGARSGVVEGGFRSGHRRRKACCTRGAREGERRQERRRHRRRYKSARERREGKRERAREIECPDASSHLAGPQHRECGIALLDLVQLAARLGYKPPPSAPTSCPVSLSALTNAAYKIPTSDLARGSCSPPSCGMVQPTPSCTVHPYRTDSITTRSNFRKKQPHPLKLASWC
jgi:hypothetical protein